MFKKLKQFAGFGKEETPKKKLVIHVEKKSGSQFRTMIVYESVYPTFKLLLQDLAAAHNAELEIIED